MAQNLNFPNHISGDTYNGRTITIKSNLLPKNLTNAIIKADFRRASPEGEIALSMGIGSGITITNALTGRFQFEKQVIDLEPGMYFYDVQITFQDADIKTYITGTWLILNSITD